jgi:flavin reductase (DIM6/NTAB) family NADH-FMN oxidoreductase RutF
MLRLEAGPVSAGTFKAGMRRLPQAISIVTVEHEGVRHGFAAGSVTSVSLEPPTLLVIVDRRGSTHDILAAAGHVCVNVVTAADRDLARQFSSPELRDLRFTTGSWTPMPSLSPALLSAEAAFDCEVVEQIAYHSHTLFMGVVRTVLLPETEGDPLVHLNRRDRRLER